MNKSKELTLLMSKQAIAVFEKQVAQRLQGRNYRILDLESSPDDSGDYGVDIAFLSRDITGNSGKTVLAPTLERFYEITRSSSSLKWVHTAAAGIDRPFYREVMDKGVVVTTSSGANAGPVAQMAVTGILALARRLPELMESQRRKAWEPLLGQRAPRDLNTQTVMIVGWGPIGQEVARLCKCLGMRVIAVRREATPIQGADAVTTYTEMKQNLSSVDWVVLACPLNDTTRNLIDASAFELLPDGARVVNVARGDVIVEGDLVAAINSGKIGGAFLDVVVKEPLEAESPLWNLPNVMISPHTAGHTQGHYAAVGEIYLDNLSRFLQSEALRNCAA